MAAGFAYPEVLEMPWTLARDFAAATARARAEALLQAAVAVRVAQHAPDKAWAQWVRTLSAGGGQ